MKAKTPTILSMEIKLFMMWYEPNQVILRVSDMVHLLPLKEPYKETLELNERYRRLEEQNNLLLQERVDYKEQLTSSNNRMKELEDNHKEQMASSMDRMKELEKKGEFFDNIACQLLREQSPWTMIRGEVGSPLILGNETAFGEEVNHHVLCRHAK